MLSPQTVGAASLGNRMVDTDSWGHSIFWPRLPPEDCWPIPGPGVRQARNTGVIPINSVLYCDVSRIFTVSGYLTWTQEIFSQIQFSFNFSSLWKMKQVQAMIWIQHKMRCVLRPLALHVRKVLVWIGNCGDSEDKSVSGSDSYRLLRKLTGETFPSVPGLEWFFWKAQCCFTSACCFLCFHLISFETVQSIESAIYSIPLEGTRGTTHCSQQDLSQRSSQGS